MTKCSFEEEEAVDIISFGCRHRSIQLQLQQKVNGELKCKRNGRTLGKELGKYSYTFLYKEHQQHERRK